MCNHFNRSEEINYLWGGVSWTCYECGAHGEPVYSLAHFGDEDSGEEGLEYHDGGWYSFHEEVAPGSGWRLSSDGFACEPVSE